MEPLNNVGGVDNPANIMRVLEVVGEVIPVGLP
jgi:hypothetical protein